MVIKGIPPFLIRIIPIMVCTEFILPTDHIFRIFLCKLSPFHAAFLFKRHFCMDKDIQYILSVPQDIISTPAYYDTGAFLCKLFNDLYLCKIKLILQWLIVLITPSSRIGCITGDIKEQAVVHMFLFFKALKVRANELYDRLLFICSSFSSINP